MSLVDGSDLVVYHGELRRRSCRVPGLWPAVAYQVTAMAWQAISNGMVASTARAVRLRAWPVPKAVSSLRSLPRWTSGLHIFR
jgi:hypothetical protein